MKRKLFVVFLLVEVTLLVPVSLSAGKFGVSGKVSMYDPPGDAGPTIMFGAEAIYKLNDYFDATGSIEWTKYKENGSDVTLIPVTVNGRFHPFGSGSFNPYIGAGAGYFYKEGEGPDVESTVGGQAIAGISWTSKKGKGLNFELRYTIPDINDRSKGGLTYTGGVTGTVELGNQ